MNIEGLLAALLVVGAGLGVWLSIFLYIRTRDGTSLVLLPALAYTFVLYAVTAFIEFFAVWEVAIRIYYRFNAVLLVTAIVTILLTRLGQGRGNE